MTMRTTPLTPDSRDEAFDRLLRQELGPDSVQSPPAALRAAIVSRVADLPQVEATPPMPRLWTTALALLFLGLVASWLLMWWMKSGAPAGDRLREGLGVLGAGGANWMDLLRSPLAAVLLPLLLLPLLHLFTDESLDA